MMGTMQLHPNFHICVVDLITTDKNKKFEPAGRMAEAMIRIALNKGECSLSDLYDHGFSAAEIATQFHLAEALASIELKLSRHRNRNLFIGRYKCPKDYLTQNRYFLMFIFSQCSHFLARILTVIQKLKLLIKLPASLRR